MRDFEILPAIDLRKGKVVQLQQGDFDREIISLDDPRKVAEQWIEEGATGLHIIDLDGAVGGKLTHSRTISSIRRSFPDVTIQVGGGIRSEETALTLLNMGVDRVILGTVAVEKPEIISRLSEKFPWQIMVAIDSRKDRVMIKGWKEDSGVKTLDLARTFEDLEISFLFTNIEVEGLMKGINYNIIERTVKSLKRPCYISGGITKNEDVLAIQETGAKGVVIGSALYTGKIDLSYLIKKLHNHIKIG
jgi:phosphoribosylformimino-5-aminoimidazole carboxamide ribotide isomerase